MKEFYKGKKILIIGGTGTLGHGLLKRLLDYEPEVIRIFSRDEAKQYDMQFEYNGYGNIRFLLGDVRDKHRLERAMEGVDIVFHTAALKHVPACEYNPFEAVKTNVLGTQNVIEASIMAGVSRVVYTSSDKAISPTNTMGATKLLAERLISAADYYKGIHKTVFSAVRFGNVMGSRGSVIPLFKKQILDKKQVTVTNPEMTRFMMSLSQAVDLTLKAAAMATGGEIFVLKMPVIRLGDLADVIIEEMTKKAGADSDNIEKNIIGLRPGEKMYEELMAEDESKGALETGEMFIIPPLYTRKNGHYEDAYPVKGDSFRSQDIKPLDKEQIRLLLHQENLI